MHFVVARYKENLHWLFNITEDYTIYNKGNDNPKYPHIKTPNIGRESETYLRYILENYNNLPNTLIFLQGNPFDHCRDLINALANYKEELFYWVGDQLLYSRENGAPHHPNLPIAKISEILNIYNPNTTYEFVSGAQFIVKSELIYKRSFKWWEHAYNLHNQMDQSPWIFERLWQYIFST